MNLYTHALLADQLSTLVRPTDPAAYLWGAVAPDIRYLAGIPRQTTHLADKTIASWFERYPDCESFIQGYRVHCLLDRIDTVRVVGKAFPFNLLRWVQRKPFSSQQMAVVIELYYHRACPQGVSLRGEHNPILDGLGVRADHTAAYTSALASYLARPSFETAAACSAQLGIIEDARVEKYIRAYQRMRSKRGLLWALTASVKNAHLERVASALYREATPASAAS